MAVAAGAFRIVEGTVAVFHSSSDLNDFFDRLGVFVLDGDAYILFSDFVAVADVLAHREHSVIMILG